MTTHAIRISVADLDATITSNTAEVSGWVQRYFGSWWHARPLTALAEPTDPSLAVSADVDPDQYRELTKLVDDRDHHDTTYARKPLRITTGSEALMAYDAHVAYDLSIPGTITLAARENTTALASAAARLAREAFRGQLADQGWVLLHASCVVDNDRQGWLAFGGKGAGKTSTALQLARHHGWSVLANDRLFAHFTSNGQVELIPWPAAAAIGIGLLDSIDDWYARVAADHTHLHTSTTTPVHTALAGGQRAPIHDGERELKPQLFPDQLTTLLDLPLATYAAAARLLFPDTRPTNKPHYDNDGRPMHEADTFTADIEDRYPNVFQLRQPDNPHSRQTVFDALNQLPRHRLDLTHNPTTNAGVFEALTRKDSEPSLGNNDTPPGVS